MRKLLLVGGIAALFAVVLAASTAASPPVQTFHFRLTCTAPSADPCPVELSTEQCGIAGTTQWSEWGNVQVFSNNMVRLEVKERYTFTSTASGKSFQSFSATQLTTTGPIDNGDGTISFVFAFQGLEQQLKLPNGPLLVRDAGQVTFTLTFLATGGFVSFTVSDVRGPHPLLESGAFCDAIVPVLTDP